MAAGDGRTHRSVPTRGGECSGTSGERRGNGPCPSGAGRSPPPTEGAEVLAAGCGHPALRKQHRWCLAAGRCRHRPLRREGEVSATTQAGGAQRSVCAADGRNEEKSEQRSTQKGPSTPDNPSVTATPCQLPLHKGAFRTGDADCRVASLLAMTVLNLCHSEEAQRADVGIRPFYDGRGFGPPSRRPLRVVAESRRNHPGSALSAEREAGQIRSLPDDLGVQHGVQGSEV